MRELSLHVLDLVENSVRAGAGVVAVAVEEQPDRDLLAISVEDDGPGLAVEPEQALDPFYTTKEGKRTGLGLSLFRQQVELAGGGVELGRSALGGLAVRARLGLAHVDRYPLGDLAGTLAGVVAANPGIEIRARLARGDREVNVSSADAGRRGRAPRRDGRPRRRRPGGGAPARAADQRGNCSPGHEGLKRSMEPTKGDRSMNQVSATAACCGEQASHEELLGRLDGVLEEYRGKPGALIPVLQIAQGIFGYLPEDVLKRVALKLGKSYSEVAGVVGFYSFFSTVPRGKHLVRVCLGTACYVRGGKLVLEGLKQELGIEVGGTTADGQFSLEVARCFGACGLAPTIMIDEDVHQRVKPLKLRAILEQYANGKAPAKKAGREAAKKPAAKKAAVGAVARPRVGAVARPRGKPEHGEADRGPQARTAARRGEERSQAMSAKITSAEELKKLRDRAQAQVSLRSGPKEVQVVVHMGTCGIAAGARDVMSEMAAGLDERRARRRHPAPVRLHRPLRRGADDDRHRPGGPQLPVRRPDP